LKTAADSRFLGVRVMTCAELGLAKGFDDAQVPAGLMAAQALLSVRFALLPQCSQ
jgi:hypothetical protein